MVFWSISDFLRNILVRGGFYISDCVFFLFLNRVFVLFSECFKSFLDDERIFVNLLLRRSYFLFKKIILMLEEEVGNERIFDNFVK